MFAGLMTVEWGRKRVKSDEIATRLTFYKRQSVSEAGLNPRTQSLQVSQMQLLNFIHLSNFTFQMHKIIHEGVHLNFFLTL